MVSTGNITNEDFLTLIVGNLETVVDALMEAGFVELGPTGLVMHGKLDRMLQNSFQANDASSKVSAA